MCVDTEDNELEVLEIIQHLVEILDRYFGSVSLKWHSTWYYWCPPQIFWASFSRIVRCVHASNGKCMLLQIIIVVAHNEGGLWSICGGACRFASWISSFISTRCVWLMHGLASKWSHCLTIEFVQGCANASSLHTWGLMRPKNLWAGILYPRWGATSRRASRVK